MDFDWHDGKHERNLRERGFGFDYAARIFAGPVIESQDTRRDYGESRIVATGEVEGNILTIVYTDRDGVRWIISARLASRKERRQWFAGP